MEQWNKPVDVDLGQCIVHCLLLITSGQGSLQKGQKNLEAVAGFDFRNKFVDRNRGRIDSCEKTLDDRLITVDIKQTSDDSRSSGRVDALNVDFDGLELLVLVEVEYQIVDEVEAIADDDQRKLLGQLGFLEEVLNLFRVKEV